MSQAEHPISIRLPEGARERAEALIPLLQEFYPGSTVKRHTVFRDALLRGLAELEHMSHARKLGLGRKKR